MDNQNTNSQDIKTRIKSHFVDINEDKFTKVKIVECKQNFRWEGSVLKNKFMLTDNVSSHNLTLKLDYRHKDEFDSVFLAFTYANNDDGYPSLSNLKMFLILDDNKTIELDDVSGIDSVAKTTQVGDNFINIYVEVAQLSISVSDFIQIANAKKIDYSIRFGTGKLDGTFSENDLNIFKGFYNSTFDEDFEVDRLSAYLNSDAAKPKAKAGGCYIATMAYGSYDHPQVLVLRDFRDNYLAKRNWGTKFISIYYKYSPKLVENLRNKVLVNNIVRRILNIFIRAIK